MVPSPMDEESSSGHKMPTGERTSADETTSTEQLRAISFRLRELQRLQAVRVEQENRRLEAEGIDPVTDANFQRTPGETE